MEIIKSIELPTSSYFRTLRAYHNLTQSDVAGRISVSIPTIVNMENDNTIKSVKFDSIIKLVEFYKNLNDGNKEI